MSRIKSLGAAVSLTASAAQTGVLMDGTPFTPGFNSLAKISLTGATGTPTVKIQGATDLAFTTPVDLVVLSAITQNIVPTEVTLMKYMRLNVTATGSAGVVTAWLE